MQKADPLLQIRSLFSNRKGTVIASGMIPSFMLSFAAQSSSFEYLGLDGESGKNGGETVISRPSL